MNRIYRLIWKKSLGSWVVASELARVRNRRASKTCRKGAAATLALLLLGPGLALAAPPSPTQLPTGGRIVAGSGNISQSGAAMTVTQNTGRMIANWQGFDIGSRASVTFHQPSAASVALNRVLSQNPTQIMGRLTANGRVMLVNPAGILFGKGSQVNVGAITASTLAISNQDFMAGNYAFANSGAAGIIDNQGRITTSDGGVVALIAPVVTNEGQIDTPKGSTLLAAGNQVSVDFSGDGLITYQVDAGTVKALVENTGSISADGGLAVMTAKAADAMSQAVVNNEGVVRAQTLASKKGHILLLSDMKSGTTQVGGTLDASAPDGGDGGTIETSGHTVKVAGDATITTKAPQGNNGTWLIDPVDFTIAASGGDMTGTALSNSLGTNNVTIQSSSGGAGSNGDINVDDTVSWSSNTLTLSAYRDIVINTEMKGSGTAKLALDYGQGSTNGVISSTTASYSLNAPVDLPAGSNFSTKLGSSGSAVNYTVIDSLGAAGSTTKTDLQGMDGDLSSHYALGADIDASATSGWNTNQGFAPIGNNTTRFTGTFDGLGHTITGLSINRSTIDIGLFGSVGPGGTVKNVGLVGVSVTGSSSNVGGLVGFNWGGSISHSYVTGSVSGNRDTGGLVGYNYTGTISNAYATCSVSDTRNATGGLVGYNSTNGTISNAYATGSVSGTYYTAGLVGINLGSITDAYATGSVSGTSNNGGLAGSNRGTISNAYATGRVSGTGYNNGGLVGSNRGTISNAYWDSGTTGQLNGYGYIAGGGWNTVNAIATSNALATSSYSNFGTNTALTSTSGTNAWFMIDGSTRPFLRSEYSTTITNAHQLQLMAMKPAASYILANDLDLTAHFQNKSDMWATDTNTPTGKGFSPVGTSGTNFTGTFDGQGHSVTGLYINRPSTNYVGLFGAVGTGGTVENVGLVGGSVTGSVNVGGLVGYSNNGKVSNSYATGRVTGSGDLVGGLVGNNFGAIRNSYATGSVSGSASVGGLAGSNFGTVSNAYATGSVNGSNYVGGLVGYNSNGTISKAYATGSVTGSSNVGGLVGYNKATVSKSYWDSGTTGQGATGIGHNSGTSNSNFPIATSNALAASSYSNFGSNTALTSTSGTNAWFMIDGSTRPFLRFEWSITITNAHQLQLMAMDPTASYTLAKDIDLTSHFQNTSDMWATDTGTSTGSGFSPIGTFTTNFTGTLDGQGHTITGLYINRPSTSNVGLFGYIGSGGTVENVGLAGGSVTGQGMVGDLAGENSGAITDAYATGSVTGTSTNGGLVGVNNPGGTISNAYATGNVSGGNTNGGLVGANNGTITDAYATGSVSGTNNGGLVAANNGTVSNSFYDSNTTGKSDTGKGTKESTTYMKTASTFSNAGWSIRTDGTDHGEVWRIYEGETYPLLTTFLTPVTATSGSSTVTYDGATQSANATLSLPAGTTASEVKGTLTASGTNAGSYAFPTTGLYSDQSGYDITVAGSGSLVINKAVLTVTADNQSRLYGGANPTFTETISGYVNNENATSAGVTGSAAGSSTAGATSNVGSYTITGSTGTLAAANYDFTAANGTLTVNKADLTATGSRTYNGTTSFSGSNLTVDGVNGETFTASGSGVLSRKDVQSNQPLASVSGLSLSSNGGDSLNNYNTLTTADTSVSVTPATLTLSATSDSKTYDGTTASSGGTVSVSSGTLYGTDTVTHLVQSFASKDVLGTDKSTLEVTGYTVNDGDNGNDYTVTTNIAAGTITPATLTATGSRTYNGTTSFSGSNLTVDGVNGETFTASGSGVLSRKDVQSNQPLSGLGTLALSSNGGDSLSNYNTLTAVDTSVSVTSAPLTVTAKDAGKTYDGQAWSGGNGVTYSGFVNGETPSVLGGALAYSGSSQGAANAGSYVITPSGLTSGNYAFTFQNGTLTVNKANLTATGSQTYSGTTTFNGANLSVRGVNGETFTASGSGTLASKNVQTDQPLASVSGLALSSNGGDSLNNYNTLTTADTSVSVTPAPLTITALTNTKTYDGTTTVAAVPTVAGIQGSDTVTGLTEAYADPTVGTGKTLTVTGYTVNDGNNGNNYTVSTVDNTTGAITAASSTGGTGSNSGTGTGGTNGSSTGTGGTLLASQTSSTSSTGTGNSFTSTSSTNTSTLNGSGNQIAGNSLISGTNSGTTGRSGTGNAAGGSPTVAGGGQVVLGGGLGAATLQLSVSGDVTMLTMSSGGPEQGRGTSGSAGLTGASNSSPERSTAVLLFNQTGSSIKPVGALTVTEQGQTLKASPQAASVASIPNVNETAMHFVTVDYRSKSSQAATPVTVGVSKDDILVVKVTPQMKSTMDENSIVLVGMSIARARLGLQPAQVKGVVVQVQ